MEIWNLLGIEPTTDKQAITDAYHEKLMATNPEDKPEEFRALRAAFEQALAQADKPAAAPEQAAPADTTPLGLWMARVRETYAQLPARCSDAAWDALLADPVCFSLGGRLAARDALLKLLAEHNYLPQHIWKKLDAFFDFHGTRSELYEKFPREFIDYGVLNAVDYPDFIRLERFAPDTRGEDADAYIAAANAFRRSLNAGGEKAREAFAALEALPAKHPYTRLAKALLARRLDDPREALAACEEYLAEDPDEEDGLLLHEQLLQGKKDFAGAEEDLNRLLAAHPDLNQARYDFVCVLEGQGRLTEAKERLVELQREQPRNSILQERCAQINKALLPRLVTAHAEHPEDIQTTLDLAWCHMQMNELPLTRTLAESLPAEMAGSYDYENLMAKLLLNEEKFEPAAAHFSAWERAIRALTQDGTAKRQAWMARLPESIRLRAWCLDGLGRTEEALALLDAVAAEFPQDAESALARAQMLSAAGRAAEAITAMDRFTALRPNDGYGFYLRGTLKFRLRQNGGAWRDFDAAQGIYGRELNCMAYKCRILMDDDRWEQAEKLLKELAGIRDSESTCLCYCRAWAMEHEGMREAANRSYQALLETLRGKKDAMERPGDAWYRAALTGEADHDYAALGTLLEEGSALQPEDMRLRDYLAFTHIKREEYARAAAIYEEMAALRPENPGPMHSLAELYRRLVHDYPRAADYYRRELALRDGAEAHAGLAKCLTECGQYAEAEAECRIAMAADPEQPAFLADLAGVLAAAGRPEAAAEAWRKALAQKGAAPQFYSSVRSQLAHQLCRLGQYEEAARLLQQSFEQGSLDALSDLAEVRERQGLFQDALSLMDEWHAREKAAGNEYTGWYLRRRAELLLEIGQNQKAADTLRQAAACDARGVLALGTYYFNAGRRFTALRLAKKCLRAAPHNYTALELAALCRWFAGDKTRAAEAAQQGLSLLEGRRGTQERAVYQTTRARLLALAGRFEEAEAALNDACRGPLCTTCNYAACRDALYTRALWYELRGNAEGARAALAAALRITPRDADLLGMQKRLNRKEHRHEDRH